MKGRLSRIELFRRVVGRHPGLTGTAAVLVALFSAFWIRNWIDAKESLFLGDAARNDGATETAILHYRHGVESYAPYADANREALDRLVAVGDASMRNGNVDRALFAYRSARFAILATRHVTVPFGAYLPALHRKIERAATAQEKGVGEVASELTRFEARLPVRWKGFSGAAIFLLWLASVPFTAFWGFRKEGKTTRFLPYLAALNLVLLTAWCCLIAAA